MHHRDAELSFLCRAAERPARHKKHPSGSFPPLPKGHPFPFSDRLLASFPLGPKRFQNVRGKDEQKRQDEDFSRRRLRKEKPPKKDREKNPEDRSNGQNPPAHTLPFPPYGPLCVAKAPPCSTPGPRRPPNPIGAPRQCQAKVPCARHPHGCIWRCWRKHSKGCLLCRAGLSAARHKRKEGSATFASWR